MSNKRVKIWTYTLNKCAGWSSTWANVQHSLQGIWALPGPVLTELSGCSYCAAGKSWSPAVEAQPPAPPSEDSQKGCVLNQSVEQCSWNAILQTRAPPQRCFTFTMSRWPSWALTRILASKLLGATVQIPHSHHCSRKVHLWPIVRVLAWLWSPEVSSLSWDSTRASSEETQRL